MYYDEKLVIVYVKSDRVVFVIVKNNMSSYCVVFVFSLIFLIYRVGSYISGKNTIKNI